MKTRYIKLMGVALVSMSLAACGNDFLDTEMSNALDLETALTSPANVGYALNGAYYNLFRYQFAGNYSTTFGDLASDITYWNGDNSHQDAIYRFGYSDTDYTLNDIWQYGYKVVDNTTRVINACDKLADEAANDGDDESIGELVLYRSEAYALRAYAYTMLANVFCHQPRVDGTDYSSALGLVLVDTPVGINDKVTRSTVGETWARIVSDLNNAIEGFETLGGDRGDLFYWGYASTCGLMARVQLYLENFADAKAYAQKALDIAGIDELTYDAAAYRALYNGGASNTESLFALAIDATNNWSANSCGTLFSTYAYSPSPKLLAMYGENDVRRSIMTFAKNSTDIKPVYAAGKFACFYEKNPAMGTNYIVNAPEMFLIEAEADLRSGSLDDAKTELLVVAKRNLDITSTADLPADRDALFSFLKDERARELFQEGHRLWDLRRWGDKVGLFAISAPAVAYTYNNVNVADIVFPIPAAEINTKAGVQQNPDWVTTRPSE